MKILILHASAGAGHKRAAEALVATFPMADADHRVAVRDILDFTPPLFRQSYAKGYLDIVISKPGGLTSSEVLSKGKPLIVIDPIPGQEQRNCEYLLEAGAALRLFEVEDAPYKIESLLADTPRRMRMAQNARALGRPQAAAEIVADVVRR